MTYNQQVSNFERSVILPALEQFNYNKTQAAAHLKMNRTTLVEACKRLKIQTPVRYSRPLKAVQE